MAFPLPPMAEQQRIVTEAKRRLAQLNDAEAALRSALARTHEQDRMTLAAACKGELVETEAALAKREKRDFIDANTVLPTEPIDCLRPMIPGRNSDPAELVAPAWLGIYPSGVVGEVMLGRQRSPQYQRGEHPTPYLRAGNITPQGLISLECTRWTSHLKIAKSTPSPGDVVLAEASGSASRVGRPAVWNGDIPNCCFQNTVLRFRPRLVRAHFAFLVFKYYAESGRFASVARGLGLQHLGAARLAKMAFLYRLIPNRNESTTR